MAFKGKKKVARLNDEYYSSDDREEMAPVFEIRVDSLCREQELRMILILAKNKRKTMIKSLAIIVRCAKASTLLR